MSPPRSLLLPNDQRLLNSGNEKKRKAGLLQREIKTVPSSPVLQVNSDGLFECVLRKKNGGLGLTLASMDEGVTVTGLASSSAADGSGIAVGDLVKEVDGVSVVGMPFSNIIARLKTPSKRIMLKLKRVRRDVPSYSNAVGMNNSKKSAVKLHIVGRKKNIKQSESAYTMGTSLWELRICSNDRDRHWNESKQLTRKLALCTEAHQAEKAQHKIRLADLQKALQGDLHVEIVGSDEVAALRRKLFASQAKIQEYEIREARRAAEAASQETRERRHAFAEAERIKAFMIYNFQCQLSNVTDLTEKYPCSISVDGVRISVFNSLFPSYQIPSPSETLSSNQRRSMIKDFHLPYATASLLFGWNFCQLIERDKQGYLAYLALSVHILFQPQQETMLVEAAFQFEIQNT